MKVQLSDLSTMSFGITPGSVLLGRVLQGALAPDPRGVNQCSSTEAKGVALIYTPSVATSNLVLSVKDTFICSDAQSHEACTCCTTYSQASFLFVGWLVLFCFYIEKKKTSQNAISSLAYLNTYPTHFL